MQTYRVSVPHPTLNPDQDDHGNDIVVADFATVVELARRRAAARDGVVTIELQGMVRVGAPNRWAVSSKGYLSVEGVSMAMCVGCGDG